MAEAPLLDEGPQANDELGADRPVSAPGRAHDYFPVHELVFAAVPRGVEKIRLCCLRMGDGRHR